MRTTFKEAFYSFDDDIINLNSNLRENIDIDIGKVKADVFARIKTESSKKTSGKGTAKKFTIILVAAVLLASMAIGTIYASESIQLIFKEFFNGNLNSAGLYDGEDIAFTSSDPNLNVELLGVTGDERRLYTVLEVTKKDGTSITDSDYIYPALLTNEDKSLWEHYECYVSYTDKDGNYFGPNADMIDYSLSDDRKSLKMMFLVSARDKNLQDSRLTITSKSFGATKMIEPFAKKYSVNEEYNSDEIKKHQNELGITDDECSQTFNGEYYEYGYADKKQYELPFKLSFTINISNENKTEEKLTTENAPDFVKPVADEVTMEITSFGININCKCNLEAYRQVKNNNKEICYTPLDYNNSKIVMNDGTEYFLYHYEDDIIKGVVQDGKKHYYKEDIVLSLSKASGIPEEPEINLIDTNQIKTILLNGNIVYSK